MNTLNTNVTMKTITGKFFKCECYREGMFVQHEIGWGTEFAFFTNNPTKRPWGNRFRLAWACLKGRPYADMVILDNQELADLVDHLIEIQNFEN